MKEKRYWMQRILDKAELPSETLPALPVIEIVGERRVLIEHHLGVTEYGPSQICVRVKYGHICIRGVCMELSRMTKGQLIINGCIDGVSLIRRER